MSPSRTSCMTSLPTASSSGIPAATSRSGPPFGYRPEIDALAFTTAATPAAMRLSAATRSMSRWSMIAISPRPMRFARSLVRYADARDAEHLHRRRVPRRARTASMPFTSTDAFDWCNSSRACRRACADRSTPASIREISLTRASSSSSVGPGDRAPALLLLGHAARARRRTRRPGRGASRRALDGDPPVWRARVRRPPRPHRRSRRRPRRTRASAAPRRARRAAPASRATARRPKRPWPAAGPARRGWARAGTPRRRRRRRSCSPGVTSTMNVADGIASSRMYLGDRLGRAARRRRAAAFDSAGGRLRDVRLGGARGRLRAAPRVRRAVRARRAGRAPRPRTPTTSARVGAVLARDLAQQRAARLHVGEPLRIGDDRLGRARARRARSRRPRPAARARARSSSANGGRPASAATAAPSASSRRTFERVVRGRRARRGAPRRRRGAAPPRDEALVLARVADRRRRRSRRAGSAAGRARGRAIVRRRPAARAASAIVAHLGARGRGSRRARPSRGAREAVEQRPLVGRHEQRLVRVLAVQVDEAPPVLGQLRHGREPAVDVAARPAVGGHDAGQRRPPRRRRHEAAFDARFGGALAHQLRVGPAAAQQLERVDEQRLARAGLAGDRGEPGPERHAQLGDDAEVLDAQLRQHRRHRSGSANFVFRIWWKSRGCTLASRSGSGAAAAAHPVAVGQRAELAPVDRELDLAPSRTTNSSSSCSASTSERSNSMCGEIGVSTMQRSAGDAIGPRAENEYAVVPGRGGDDHAVGRVRRERAAVDRHVEADHVPGALLLEHGLVERVPRARPAPPASTSTASTMRSDTSNSPATSRGSERVELVRLDLAQVAELPDVHADDRHRRRIHELHRVEHRAVAAERQHEVETVGERVAGAPRTRRGRRCRVVVRDAHLDLVRAEPVRSALRERVRLGTLAVRDEPDRARSRGPPGPGGPPRRARRRRDRHRTAARVREELDVAVGAAQRRRDDRTDAEPGCVEAGDDFAQHRRVHHGVAHDAAPAEARPPRLELRLDEQHEVGIGVGDREQMRRDGAQRDERDVDDAQIGRGIERARRRGRARSCAP